MHHVARHAAICSEELASFMASSSPSARNIFPASVVYLIADTFSPEQQPS
ncbi:MAG TPA: hypothetical protein VFO30_07230 [Chthoniobacterales bacterium]|nr:hypothetical protein [Chthoniobacterales bacterium]